MMASPPLTIPALPPPGRKAGRAACLSNSRPLRAVLGATIGLIASLAGSHGAEAGPNVLIILADDLGYADLTAQGCRDFATPNIDSIAKNGVRLTDGYMTAPVCGPSRAGLISGRYQQRFGYEINPGHGGAAKSKAGMRMPGSEITFAERMKGLGYATGVIGKWHLGDAPDEHPLRQGFDEFFGFIGGARSYFAEEESEPVNTICRGYEPVNDVTYATDMFGAEAVSYIERHKAEPWFLYLAFNAVHTPMDSKPESLSRFKDIADPKRRKLAAMAVSMDENVGLVLEALRKTGQYDNTIIFFASDNGGPEEGNNCPNATDNGPLRGTKTMVTEGGIRVPMFIQWPGHIPAGSTYGKPVISLDWLPTALAAGGGNPAEDRDLDGVDLLPYLTGKNAGTPHDRLYWRSAAKWAIRQGDWKLCADEAGKPRLHDLSNDVGETTDLADKEPGKFKELEAAWNQWSSELPAFRNKGGKNIKQKSQEKESGSE